MANVFTPEMLERIWNNSIEYAKQYFNRHALAEEGYIWLLDSPKLLMVLTPAEHEDMTVNYGDKPEYHFIRYFSTRDCDMDSIVDEVARECA